MTEWEKNFVRRHRVARLATVDTESRPHVVPVVYAYDGDGLYTPIDEKPKQVGAYQLQRACNIQANPDVAVIIDDYAEDWQQLAWVQTRGTAAIVETGPAHEAGVQLLHAKYPQYESMPLHDRPVIAITITRVVSWRARDY